MVAELARARLRRSFFRQRQCLRMNPSENEYDFIASLHDAMRWSVRMLNGTTDVTRLRSSELASSHPGIDDSYGQSMSAINSLVDARSRLLGAHKMIDLPNERLLCCDFAASEASGASELASDGYFNEFDLPPWDTWVAWVTDFKPAHEHNGFILAFVPPSFNECVQLGIDANPVNCVFWLDAPDAYTMNRLKHVMPKWMAQYGKTNAR